MTNNVKEVKPIKCPYCGCEYYPDEVFYPESVFGETKAGSIVRDGDGHIIYHEWKKDGNPLESDTYYCDHCGKQFVVKVKTEVIVEEQQEELDFTTQETSLL